MMTELAPYQRTAARPAGRPGREVRPDTLTVDLHCHAFVREAWDEVVRHVEPAKVARPRSENALTMAVNRRQNADRMHHLTNIDQRLFDMDEMGIDMQAIIPSPNLCFYELDPELGRRMHVIVNDRMAEIVAKRPDQFVALGVVPLQETEVAVAELERCVRELGLRGVQVLAWVDGDELSAPRLEPFWAKAAELGTLVFIHPNGFSQGERFGEHYFDNIIGHPLATAVALQRLIFDGVLERHPGLKILAAHGGGYLPAYAGRMDHAWGAREDCRTRISQPPSTYLKRLYFDTVVFAPEQVEHLVRVFGADHVIMGTDYPYDMGDYDPISLVEGLTNLDNPSKSAIAGGNAKTLLGIG
jgi:aminocarboxymuconate-semialdehyde decarboxylase